METPRRNWLLILSLCVNLALIGGIAVIVWRIAHIDTSVGSGGPLAPHSLMREFPGEQAGIQKAIDAHRAKMLALRQAEWQARLDALHQLGAADYSQSRMSVSLNAVAAADAALEVESIAMSADSLATLSAAERQALVDHLNKRGRSWFFRTMRKRAQH